ncbi:glycosyltransferase family 4 protein [Granulicoccus sp. GXG6511]|uniref:glycosyltransferase family 4 protein n=1 Tax=Granulicoccus sp. GXG6511 TaxID=3381351 RepID=UPI003D7DFF4C
MRIGLVCPYSFAAPGGVQNHVLGLAGWLRAQGHDPAILAPGPVPEQALARRGLDPTHFTSLGDTLAIPWNGSIARVSGGPGTALRVRRWLAEQRLDVLHLHEPVTPSAALWALLAARMPIVATFHLATERSRLLALAGQALARPLRDIDRAIAVSATAAAVVRRHLGLEPTIVSNGIDVTDFALPRQSFSPQRVAFLGRLAEPRKGLGVLLAALPRLRTLFDAPLDVVVAGPGEPALPPDVRYLGAPDDDGRAELLRTTDVLVAPNLGGESFGLILVEAMAAGAPVVASDLPAFVDVLTADDGRKVGRTFPVGDARALARAIHATLGDPVASARQLREHAARFDWSVVGPLVLDNYRRARGRG